MIGRAAETEEAAARWLLRQEEAGWSQSDREAFETWLNASPEHSVAYYRLEYGWRRADAVADLSRETEPPRNMSAGARLPGE